MNEAQETQGRWQVRRERDPDDGTGIIPVVYYDGCAEDEEIWMPHSPIGARRLAEQLNDLEARLADAEQRAERNQEALRRTYEELREQDDAVAQRDREIEGLRAALIDIANKSAGNYLEGDFEADARYNWPNFVSDLRAIADAALTAPTTTERAKPAGWDWQPTDCYGMACVNWEEAMREERCCHNWTAPTTTEEGK